jgi:(heptosyl)LPS beta-1,4-glucosyltransferase
VTQPTDSKPAPTRVSNRSATPVTVVILTKNEEELIGRCIAGASFADEVLVVDCGSEDRTREIAAENGATVVEQEWLGWSEQRNHGAAAARNDWIFILEADEIPTDRLVSSLQEVLAAPMDPADGYALERRSDFLGALMPNEARRSKRRSFVRLYNRTRSKYNPEHPVHEEVVFPGRAIPIEGVLLHWRGQSMDALAQVFNRYAGVEAEALDAQGVRAGPLKIFGRPVLRFLWCYVRKGGFRQGTRGLMWALLKGTGEYYRYSKLWERQNLKEPVTDPPPEILRG